VRLHNESGIALLTTMMVMLLLSSMLVGFGVMVASDSQLSAGDLGRTEAFYAAQAGLEQLTSDLGMLFVSTPAPAGSQVRALVASPPVLPNTTFVKPDSSSGYEIAFPSTTGDPDTGDPITTELTVASGPFAGLIGQVTPYTLTVTARKGEGAEASLERFIQTVSLPIFEFGVFATQDVSVFADQPLTLQGRVHTNFSLFTATSGGPLQFPNRISVGADLIRTHLQNGYPVDTWGGNVEVTTAPGVYRPLAPNEGSLVGTTGSALNEPTWFNLSTGTYNSRIITGRTGARPLQLPVSILGGQPIDLIRRPIPGETTAAALFPERHFSRASVRILLSDEIADITSLPGVTTTTPIDLASTATWAFALSKEGTDSVGFPAEYAEGYRFPASTSLLGGFLKIEIQTAPGLWVDVTTEILNQGFVGEAVRGGGLCTGQIPHPDAVIRLQHVREGAVLQNPDCGVPYPAAPDSTDYWPNVLFDAREGLEREDADPLLDRDPHLGGLMHYVELDVGNLTRWLSGTLGVSGASALHDNGYLVYVSDRRTNNDLVLVETGEYGYEDFVNTGVSGIPNGIHEPGEDVNANGALDTYGMTPMAGAGGPPLDPTATVTGTVPNAVARTNPAIFFRRALKLVNGGLGNLPVDGLTVTSENPVYVEGHYNANASGFQDPHVSAAVIADAVTLLSTAWNDWNSLDGPHDPADAAPTYYRLAVATGTSLTYPQPSGTPIHFGTDGSLENLMRLLENWTGDTLFYRGALAPLWTSRQARGSYKCCTNVFLPPTTLAFEHDTDFLNMSLLPPATPVITDVNITGFRQILRAQ
jgi:hypothetical protein